MVRGPSRCGFGLLDIRHSGCAGVSPFDTTTPMVEPPPPASPQHRLGDPVLEGDGGSPCHQTLHIATVSPATLLGGFGALPGHAEHVWSQLHGDRLLSVPVRGA